MARLKSIQNIKVVGMRAFLDLAPLAALRKRGLLDPPRLVALMDKVLKHARGSPNPKDAELYVKTNVRRFKIELLK